MQMSRTASGGGRQGAGARTEELAAKSRSASASVEVTVATAKIASAARTSVWQAAKVLLSFAGAALSGEDKPL
jgi:hypothetical protein